MSESLPAPPSFRELLRVFGHIGLINFGGPAGQIALMHKVLVDERRWIDEDAYLRALNFCTLLPGPEAQQLATYVGWKLHGIRGGLAAGLLFVLPGAAVVLALSVLYAYAADLSWVSAALLGVKAAVLAVVVEALLRISRRALNAPLKWIIAGAAFLALAVFQAPFPAVVGAAAVVGLVAGRFRPEALRLKTPPPREHAPLGESARRAFATAAVWAALWGAPLALAAVTLGRDHVLFEIGLFFAKLATVTFGGAYAVLSYMAQSAVAAHGWLKPAEMVDGLGLAETTPGPLILVTEFVGFLAAFRAPAPFAPLVAGLLGAAMTLWMTFAPCFMWIFAGAPLIDRLESARPLQGALAAVTASVVGVIANLTLWFAIHVLFGRFQPFALAGRWLSVPDPSSLLPGAAVLTVLAGLLLFRFHVGVIRTLGVAVAAGLLLHLVGWA